MRRGKLEKKERHNNALILQEERAKRTDQEQLQRLDEMFGKGKGAKKERARLDIESKGKK
jgi:hypothetical protein